MDKLISGKTRLLGQSIAYDLPIPLDAATYVGAQVYATNGQMYYSNGVNWVVAGGGYTGSKGDTGDPGEQGFTGSQGYTGSLGFTGSGGQGGFTGSAGAGGFTGSAGDPGYTGSAGAGYTGSKGDIGYTGSKGTPPLQVVNLWQYGSLTVITGIVRWYAAFPLDVTKITARLGTAADRPVNIQIMKNTDTGTTTATTISIPGSSIGPVTTSTVINMNTTTNDYLTVNLTQVGAGATGTDLYLQFIYNGTAYI